jgi:hypothetical protein
LPFAIQFKENAEPRKSLTPAPSNKPFAVVTDILNRTQPSTAERDFELLSSKKVRLHGVLVEVAQISLSKTLFLMY